MAIGHNFKNVTPILKHTGHFEAWTRLADILRPDPNKGNPRTIVHTHVHLIK